MSLPNIISLSRIFCIPPFIFWVTHVHINNNYRYFALLTMLCAGLGDILDGYLARKKNAITRLGRYLDPVADKLLLITACVLLSSDRFWPEPRFPNWLPTIVVIRDISIALGTGGLILFTGKTLGPSRLGKMTTFFQISAVVSVLLGNHIPSNAITTLWWITAAFICASMVNYAYKGMKQRLRVKE